VDGKYSNLVKDDPSAAGISRTDLHDAISAIDAQFTNLISVHRCAPPTGAASSACLTLVVRAVTFSNFDALVLFTPL
jgi:hypothetical protein